MPKSRQKNSPAKQPNRRRRPTAAQRRVVEARANGTCEYCRCLKRFVPQPFNVEHIVPFVLGGQTAVKNLAWACGGCNFYKHDKVEAVDPQTSRTVNLFHPRRQRWAEHFAWSADATLVIGLTATGRATIRVLRLNREELINLRRVLRAFDLHPPQD